MYCLKITNDIELISSYFPKSNVVGESTENIASVHTRFFKFLLKSANFISDESIVKFLIQIFMVN